MNWTTFAGRPAKVTAVANSPAKSKVPALLNTAGQLEPEARSRRDNLIEPLLVMVLLLATLWCLAYPLGVLLQCRPANLASRVQIGLLLGFALLLAPWRHRDSLSSRGLGSPLALVRWLTQGRWATRLAKGAGLAALLAGLTAELYRNATGATRLILGVEPVLTLNLQQTLGGHTVVLGLCLAVALVWAAWFIRYDNLGPALKAAAAILAVLLPALLLLGWALNGTAFFLRAKPAELLRNALAYSFWGALQQLLFCGYFATRLRKGFPPASTPPRPHWKRLAVAMLSGLPFGLVHINSWCLVGFTWMLGSVLAWFFMEDRYRNLQAMGLVHGVLGTCLVWLFSGRHEPLHIRLRVGPWAMPHQPDLPTLLVTGALLLTCGTGLLLLARGRPQVQPARSDYR